MKVQCYRWDGGPSFRGGGRGEGGAGSSGGKGKSLLYFATRKQLMLCCTNASHHQDNDYRLEYSGLRAVHTLQKPVKLSSLFLFFYAKNRNGSSEYPTSNRREAGASD